MFSRKNYNLSISVRPTMILVGRPRSRARTYSNSAWGDGAAARTMGQCAASP